MYRSQREMGLISAVDIAQAHVDRIARKRAEGRARLQAQAPDVLELADALRARFGSGVRMYEFHAKQGSDPYFRDD